MKRYLTLIAAAAAALGLATGCSPRSASVSSPDGSLSLEVSVRDGRVGYTLHREGKALLDFSTLGFELKDAPALRDGLEICGTETDSFDETWEQVWGEEHFVRNHYNELTVSLREQQAPNRRFDVVFRLFDDGMGFRCEFPEQPDLGEFVIMDELTEFRFPEDHMAWWMPTREPYYESIARHTTISQMDTVNTPLTIECVDGEFLALHEANLTDYAKMSLYPVDGGTTENMMRYIDFAAENGIEGVLAEGWNVGWDGEWTKNSDKIRFAEPYPDFDIDRIADYAAKKGVQLIGHHETGANTKNYEAQMEEAFAFCRRYGIHAVKTGYVNVLMDGKELHDSQYGVRHYRKVIETAARYNIMIDNHEPVMPTGLERTWPNLMTQEGVRGQEYNAWSPDGGNPPEHTTVVPFLRGLAGPMDYTFGTFDFSNPVSPFARVQSTIARELAQYVVIYSPMQMASDLPEHYAGQPAFAFIRDVATDWERTLVPQAVIGDYCVFARQKRDSQEWFLGAITDETPRTLTVALDFLDPQTSYKAQIYADGEKADWKTNPCDVAVSERQVVAGDSLQIRMASGGGCAIRFVPEPQK